MRRALILLFGLTAQGCFGVGVVKPSYVANPQLLPLEELTVFRDNSGPVSYQSAQLADVGNVMPVERVQGQACQRGLSLPVFAVMDRNTVVTSLSVGWGHGAYREALEKARDGLPDDAVLYDVRVDLNLRMILTFYRELCLKVDAAVALPSASAAPVAPAQAPTAPAPAPSEPAPKAPPAPEPVPPSAALAPAKAAVPEPVAPAP